MFRAFSIDNSVMNTPDPIEHSSSATTLLNELQRVKEDLKHKDIEIQRAHEIRDNTDREIEDLTASLFEVTDRVLVEFRLIRLSSSRHIRWSNKPNSLKPTPSND